MGFRTFASNKLLTSTFLLVLHTISSIMSSFAEVYVNDIFEQLTIDEVIMLTSGSNFWYTQAIPRLNIPAIKFTDGPNGWLYSSCLYRSR